MGRVVILKSLSQAEKAHFEALKINYVECPLIEIRPIKENLQKLTQDFLRPFKTLLFTSQKSVDLFFLEERKIQDKKIGAVGPLTKKALEMKGVRDIILPPKYEASSLFKMEWEPLVLYPSASKVSVPPPKTFFTLPIYDNVEPKNLNFSIKENDSVFFTSQSQVERFFNSSLYQGENIISFCIGDKTAEAVTPYMRKRVHVAKEKSLLSMLDCLIADEGRI